MRKRSVFFTAAGMVVLCILFPGWDISYAACEEECAAAKSCLNYSECTTARLQCQAACKEKEAWESASKSYEKTVETQQKLIDQLEAQNNAIEKLLKLIDSLVTKINKMEEAGESEASQKESQAK